MKTLLSLSLLLVLAGCDNEPAVHYTPGAFGQVIIAFIIAALFWLLLRGAIHLVLGDALNVRDSMSVPKNRALLSNGRR